MPLGAIAHRYRWSYATLITLAGLLYTIPSLALFVVLPGLLGTRILDPVNVVVALTLYTVALLVRVVADALDAVPPLVVASATAMGYRPLRSLLTVQLPLAIPVIGAGLRVAAVSNVSLVSVAALLGIPQLGQLFTVGFQLDFFTPIMGRDRAVPAAGRDLRRDHPVGGAAEHPVDEGGEGAMTGAWAWLTDPANWSGTGGVWTRLVQHLWYSMLSLIIALAIALPLGAVIGHTGRFTGLVSGVANALRALPSLGLLILLALWGLHTLRGDIALLGPAIAVLVILAVPPILSNTYAGIANVDPAARDAARGMGMTGSQVLFRVELPVAMPLIMSGVRSAFLQVVATATIAAVVALGGFGRYVIDGLAQSELPDDGGRRDPGRRAGRHRGPDPGRHRALRRLPRSHRTGGPAAPAVRDHRRSGGRPGRNRGRRMTNHPAQFRCRTPARPSACRHIHRRRTP